MSLSVAANLTAGTLGTNPTRAAKKLKDGASVKDIVSESRDKFVNRAKTAGKAGVVLAGAGATGALAGLEMTTGVISKHLPKCVTNLVEKAATSNVVKSAANMIAEGLSTAGTFVKAHPIACAAVLAAGTIGQLIFNNIVKDGAKNEGKIEQKYDDILDLKNAAAKNLE